MRRKLDAYFTPRKATEHLLSVINPSGIILECCSGTGAITQPLRDKGLFVLTNDLDISYDSDWHADATDDRLWEHYAKNLDWVISNPPYSVAFPIVRHAVEAARVGVAMLLRLSFLEPTYERGEWLSLHPPRIIAIPRISFTEDGKTDSVATAWFLWERNSQIGNPNLGNIIIPKYKVAKTK